MRDLCPRCAGPLKTRQLDLVRSKYCEHCGCLPHAYDFSADEAVTVDRSGIVISRQGKAL